jgi:hypothetical protein
MFRSLNEGGLAVELFRAAAIVGVSLSLLCGNAGCVISSMMLGNQIPASDQIQTQDSPKFETTAVSTSDGVQSNNGVLALNDLQPEQQVCLVTRCSDEMTGQGTTSDATPGSFAMIFSLDHVNGTIVSVDSSRIVLRDVVITSDRSDDSPGKKFNLIPRIFPTSAGVAPERRYTEVPGELVLHRNLIRGAQKMTPEQMKSLMEEVEKARPEYVKFNFND